LIFDYLEMPLSISPLVVHEPAKVHPTTTEPKAPQAKKKKKKTGEKPGEKKKIANAAQSSKPAIAAAPKADQSSTVHKGAKPMPPRKQISKAMPQKPQKPQKLQAKLQVTESATPAPAIDAGTHVKQKTMTDAEEDAMLTRLVDDDEEWQRGCDLAEGKLMRGIKNRLMCMARVHVKDVNLVRLAEMDVAALQKELLSAALPKNDVKLVHACYMIRNLLKHSSEMHRNWRGDEFVDAISKARKKLPSELHVAADAILNLAEEMRKRVIASSSSVSN
jgi:hypothetical protein